MKRVAQQEACSGMPGGVIAIVAGPIDLSLSRPLARWMGGRHESRCRRKELTTGELMSQTLRPALSAWRPFSVTPTGGARPRLADHRTGAFPVRK